MSELSELFGQRDLLHLVATLLDGSSIARLRMANSKTASLKSAEAIRYVTAMRTAKYDVELTTLEQIALAESIAELQTAILFQYRDVQLQESSYAPLDRFAALLNRHDTLTVNLEGHCGLEAPRIMGFSFTRARANAVKEVLVSRGVAESRINVVGYSNTRPLVWRNGDRHGAANRRVELYVNVQGVEVPKRRPLSAYASPPGLERTQRDAQRQRLDDDVEAVARLILDQETHQNPDDDDLRRRQLHGHLDDESDDENDNDDDDEHDLSFLPIGYRALLRLGAVPHNILAQLVSRFHNDDEDYDDDDDEDETDEDHASP